MAGSFDGRAANGLDRDPGLPLDEFRVGRLRQLVVQAVLLGGVPRRPAAGAAGLVVQTGLGVVAEGRMRTAS
jgi:hypothetical protein